MSSAANYVGRTIDVLAFGGVPGVGDTLTQQSLAANEMSGQICTGIQKLAQRWLLEFLTEQGSIFYLPQRGCQFMTLLQENQLRTNLDVTQAFYLSAATVQLNLQVEDANATPAPPSDERYASVTLLSVNIVGDTLYLRVQLYSQAGTSRVVVLPLNTTLTPTTY